MDGYQLERLMAEAQKHLFGSTLDLFKNKLAYDARLLELWRVIEAKHMDLDFDLLQASRECGMSKNNLNNLLRKRTGFTCWELVMRYRVYRSILIALTRNSNFAQIAFDCGFGSPSTFARTMRRLFKNSPTRLLPRGLDYGRILRLPDAATAKRSDKEARFG